MVRQRRLGASYATYSTIDAAYFSEEAAKRRMAESFKAAAERPLWTGTAVRPFPYIA